MQNNFLKDISPTVRLLLLIIMIVSTILAKSIYLVLFITTIILILSLYSKRKVKEYVKFIKKVSFTLFIFLIIYIIIMKEYDILNIIIVAYKEVLIALLIKLFKVSMNFNDLNLSIYGLLYPLKKFNIKDATATLVISLYFFKYWLDSKEFITNMQKLNVKRNLGFKYYYIPRLIYTIHNIEKLKLQSKINFFDIQNKKINFKSKIILIISIIFFIACIFKEVIL